MIEIIRDNPTITRKELAVRLNMSEGGVRYNTAKLQSKGILRRGGGKKLGRWEVVEGRFRRKGVAPR
ncbi:MAG: winged helix-turn-helix domain-containing protein [Nitrospirae bacterium]|nr:winged helix-turn-helix domain-containing protein [Nitrospirota bacterium]